jgi:hypothetical protein
MSRCGVVFKGAGVAIAVATAGPVVVPGVASAAPTTSDVASVSRVTPVTRLGGWTIWSAFTPGRGYVLTGRTGTDAPVALPVPPRKVPFDADLGRDADGNLVVAYSRCRTEPKQTWSATTYLPLRIEGKGCDIYTYRQGAKAETRIKAISSPRTSEILPSIDRDRIAFVRVAPRSAGKPYRATVQVATLGTHTRVRQQKGGPVGTNGLPGPSGLDLSGNHVAVTWASRTSSADGIGAFASDSRLFVDTLGGTSRVVQRVTQGGESSLMLQAPSIDGAYVYYSAEGYDRPNVVSRATLSSGKVTSVPAPLYVTGLAADAGTLAMVVAPGDPTLGASSTCTGVHTPTFTQGQEQDTTCDIQTMPLPTFHETTR